jgi:hypothetical protein
LPLETERLNSAFRKLRARLPASTKEPNENWPQKLAFSKYGKNFEGLFGFGTHAICFGYLCATLEMYVRTIDLS